MPIPLIWSYLQNSNAILLDLSFCKKSASGVAIPACSWNLLSVHVTLIFGLNIPSEQYKGTIMLYCCICIVGRTKWSAEYKRLGKENPVLNFCRKSIHLWFLLFTLMSSNIVFSCEDISFKERSKMDQVCSGPNPTPLGLPKWGSPESPRGMLAEHFFFFWVSNVGRTLLGRNWHSSPFPMAQQLQRRVGPKPTVLTHFIWPNSYLMWLQVTSRARPNTHDLESKYISTYKFRRIYLREVHRSILNTICTFLSPPCAN